jgi:hypothetical protein
LLEVQARAKELREALASMVRATVSALAPARVEMPVSMVLVIASPQARTSVASR